MNTKDFKESPDSVGRSGASDGSAFVEDELWTSERKRKLWNLAGWILAVFIVCDFVCYQLYGVGLIFGNILIIDVRINAGLHP